MKKEIYEKLEKLKKEFNINDYNEYINGVIRYNDLMLKYNATHYLLDILFKEMKLEYREKVLQNTTIHQFFDSIDSEIKAYLIGFYLADGSLSKDGRISISVTEKDQYILELYKKYISPHYKITLTKEHKNRQTGYVSKPMANLRIKSAKIANTLTKYNIGNKKTYNNDIDLSFIPEKYFFHFLRGYFDGDGCVCVTNGTRKYTLKNGEEKYYTYQNYNWNIISFNERHLYFIKDFLKKYNIKSNILKNKKCYLIEINKKEDFFKMRDLLYKDSNFYLTRKKEKYMGIPC